MSALAPVTSPYLIAEVFSLVKYCRRTALAVLVPILLVSGAFGGPLTQHPTPEPALQPANSPIDTEGVQLNSSGARDVPEPGTLTALGLGLLAVGLVKRQRSQSR
jgi:hypothetical protein